MNELLEDRANDYICNEGSHLIGYFKKSSANGALI